MKTILIITVALIIFLLAVIWTGVTEMNTINRTQQSEIEWLLKRNQELERENKTFRMALDSAKIKYK